MHRSLKCFSPLAGIAMGFAVGAVVYEMVRGAPGGYGPAVDWGLRLYMLFMSVAGWCVTTVWLRKRKLHCGGTEQLVGSSEETEIRMRYVWVAFASLAVLIVAPLLIEKGALVVYYSLIGVVGLLLAGEIGWGQPLFLIRKALPYNSEDDDG